MGVDLSEMMRDWPYEPGQINVRVIRGDDGEHRLQMRIDLGILQMEMTGRPDGTTYKGYESLLDYYEAVLDGAEDPPGPAQPMPPQAMPPQGMSDQPENENLSADAEGSSIEPPSFDDLDLGSSLDGELDSGLEGPAGPDDDVDGPEFYLGDTECRQLREEALQYYHRYIALLVLGDYDGVVRDTTRNLRVLDLCREFAEDENDRLMLEQFRPYIIMMRARALASHCVGEQEPKSAMMIIDRAINEITVFFEEHAEPGAAEQSHELALLRGMRDELSNKLPASQKAELRQRLHDALAAENYELAAILRDELKMMRE